MACRPAGTGPSRQETGDEVEAELRELVCSQNGSSDAVSSYMLRKHYVRFDQRNV